jgi:hypothetical protein
MKNALCIVILAFLLMGSVSALAQMRCGTDLITTGDLKSRVYNACGKPYRIDDDVFGADKWIYNFGPNEFIRVISFDDDRVEEITDGEYGFVTDN